MNERLKVMLLLGLIFLVVGGAGFYFFIYEPLQQRNSLIASLESGNQEKDAEIRDIERKLPELQKMQQRSLPVDVEFARREYEVHLNSMLRRSGFNMADVRIDPRPASTAGAPPLTKSKAAYTKLEYGVTVPEAKTDQLVRFLESFYRENLLHQIRSLTITRSAAAVRGSKEDDSKDVQIRMTVEAIVLDRAEDRDRLLPDSEKVPPLTLLAKEDRHYTRILEKDPFFGPPPPPPAPSIAEEGPPPPDPFDVGPYMRLTGITFQDVRSSAQNPALHVLGGALSASVPEFRFEYATADLYDRYHNRAYTIGMAFDGFSVVQGYIFELGDDGRKKDEVMKSFFLEFMEDGKKRKYSVVRIDPTDIILQEPVSRSDKKARVNAKAAVAGAAVGAMLPKEISPTFRWHIGDDFAKIQPVPMEEARKLLQIPAGLAVVKQP